MSQRVVNLSDRRLGGGVIEAPDAGHTEGFAGAVGRLRALGRDVLREPEAIFAAPVSAYQGVIAFEVLRRLRDGRLPQVAPLPEPGQMPNRWTSLDALFLAAGDRRHQRGGHGNLGTTLGIIGTAAEEATVMGSRSLLEENGEPISGELVYRFRMDPYADGENGGAIATADAFNLSDWSIGRIGLIFGADVSGYTAMVLLAELYGRRQARPPEVIAAFGPEGLKVVKLNACTIWTDRFLGNVVSPASAPGTTTL